MGGLLTIPEAIIIPNFQLKPINVTRLNATEDAEKPELVVQNDSLLVAK